MKVWKIKEKIENISENLLGKYDPVILQLLFGRGLKDEKDIESYFSFDYEKDLGDPKLISGMEEAVKRIVKARDSQEKVAIFGDYDADGVSSSALLFEVFSDLGFKNVVCYIPDRQTEGYGMNEKALKYLSKEKINLIITVDCGITNISEVEKAKKLGLDVIVTDHHYALEKIPGALAVINPTIPKSGFEFKELAGVGVAFKLAQALYQGMAPENQEKLKWLLDLVALGTIADCVPLFGENRVLVKYGLIVFSKTRRIGLQEMFKIGRIDISDGKIPDARKIAFQVAPRINAAGRMDHANVAYKLLIEKDRLKARDMALELEKKNQERQKMTKEIFREVQVLAKNSFKDKKMIFAENTDWPVGILGLVAGKITEEFQKPTIILQRQKEEYIGSLRSIPEVNIIELLEKCSDLLFRFGGHSQAAGVSVKHENIEKFYEKISKLVEIELKDKKQESFIKIDCEVKAEDINWELIEELKKMEPFGNSNEEPIFIMKKATIFDLKVVGNGQKHWKLSIRGESDSPKIFDGIGFSLVNKFPNLKKNDKMDVVFTLSEDEWNGNKKIQLKLIDLRLID